MQDDDVTEWMDGFESYIAVAQGVDGIRKGRAGDSIRPMETIWCWSLDDNEAKAPAKRSRIRLNVQCAPEKVVAYLLEHTASGLIQFQNTNCETKLYFKHFRCCWLGNNGACIQEEIKKPHQK